jgi:DNA repair exonuclease SbcCD nuclease subunit
MFKLLHTSNWHLGRKFSQFPQHHDAKLRAARLVAVENLLTVAESYGVNAVLCAGDLFDQPTPDESTWQGLRTLLENAANPERPIVLLPGTHDPLVTDSVYEMRHEFRRNLPEGIYVVDDDNFSLELQDTVICSIPCKKAVSDEDLAMQLPKRDVDDKRTRIGLIHGNVITPEVRGNYPISLDALDARGLDLIVSGDPPNWQEIKHNDKTAVCYPGAPEPISFEDNDSSYVALITFRRSGSAPRVKQEKVGTWEWRNITINSPQQLIDLSRETLDTTALRLQLDFTVDLHELDVLESTLETLAGNENVRGRAGAFICDRSKLQVNASEWSIDDLDLPDSIHAAAERLKSEISGTDTEQAALAQRAILVLRKLLKEKEVLA